MRAQAMPGEDPDTLPSPANLAPLFLELLSKTETRTGDAKRFNNNDARSRAAFGKASAAKAYLSRAMTSSSGTLSFMRHHLTQATDGAGRSVRHHGQTSSFAVPGVLAPLGPCLRPQFLPRALTAA